MSDTYSSARYALPLLAVGQAQKEVTHNEALTLVDLVLNPVVEAVGETVPPAAPEPGQAWVVGAVPSGAWTGAAHRLAGWTTGGWRFVDLPPFATVVVRMSGRGWQRTDMGWTMAPTIAAPSGGTSVDAECRAALSLLLSALSQRGIIATN